MEIDHEAMRLYISSRDAIKGAIQRCYCSTNNDYAGYGGRGIRVAKRWRDSWERFIDDMGVKPSADHSLDRIDNDRGYEPGNCRWADWSTQANNRRPPRR